MFGVNFVCVVQNIFILLKEANFIGVKVVFLDGFLCQFLYFLAVLKQSVQAMDKLYA